MGSSGSRPSCLGEKSPRAEDFLKDSYLKDLGLAPGPSAAGRNNAGGHAGPFEKPPACPVVIENGWSVGGPGPGKGRQSSPLPKRNNTELQGQRRRQQEGRLGCIPLEAPQRGLGSGWIWKPVTTTTEVTEVTETVVTEIVEVTEYPGGAGSREPVLAAATVMKVLAECAGALPQAAALLGDPWSTEQAQETLAKVLSWVRDVEELVADQKAPSSEAKVVKAQLQEQKLLRRLLDDRRPQLERLLQERPGAATAGTSPGGHERDADLASLQGKWAGLVQGAEARHSCLEQVFSAAQAFQALVDPLQDWLGATERTLAQLWRASGSASHVQEAHRQAQDICEEMRSKPEELDQVLVRGQQLLELVSGEESRLAQERMDSLRTRLLIVGRSSADVQHRLQQALDASSRLDPAQEDLALWLGRMEKELPPQGGPPGVLSAADGEKFQWALDSGLAQVTRLSKCLEGQGPVPLDADGLRLQVASQKQLAAEILHQRGLVERLTAIADPLLSLCPSDVQLQLQPLVQPLQERMRLLVQQSAARALRLEQAQVLLAQHREAREELCPWLEETQQALAQVSPHTVSCETFREQQEMLQGLREAMAEHRPLLAKLQRVSAQLAELSPEEVAPFREGWQQAEEQFGRVRGQVCQAAAVLEEAIPRYSQLSERMALMSESLERLQSHAQHPPAARGDAAWVREQLRANSLQLAELEKLGVALETLRGQGAELLATVQTCSGQAIQDRVEQLQQQWKALCTRGEERERWLRGLLALADRFWDGLSELAASLTDTQQAVLELEEAPWDPEATQAKLGAMQTLREEIDSLQGDLDALGLVALELTSSCGDLDKPDVTKSLDDVPEPASHLASPPGRGAACPQLHAASGQAGGRAGGQPRDSERTRKCPSGGPDIVLGALSWRPCGEGDCEEQTPSEWQECWAGQDPPPPRLPFRLPFRLQLYVSWNSLSKVWAERQTRLQEQLQASLAHQEAVERLLGWLAVAELRITEEFQVGGAPEVVKQQLLELKDFKRELYQCKVEAESLRRQGGPRGAGGTSRPSALDTFCHRWSRLEDGVVSRQHQLEAALLGLGQFQSQLQELLQWLQHTTEQLRGSPAPSLDLQGCEIELAKHKVLRNDILSHARTVQAVNEAGQGLLLSSGPGGPGDGALQDRLRELNRSWDVLLGEAESRQLGLESDLSQAQDIALETTELRQWLEGVEVQLSLRQPPCGRPEAARDMLGAHLELCQEMDSRQLALSRLREQVGALLAASPPPRAPGTEHSLSLLQQRWERVASQVQQRKEQLSEGLAAAVELHTTLQELLEWLGGMEERLGALPSPSGVLETAVAQIQGQKALARETQAQSERLAGLEAAAARLKGLGWRPDCSATHCLVLSAGERLAKVRQRLSERDGALQEAHKRAKQFSESRQRLLGWLEEAGPALDAGPAAGSLEDARGLLGKHKEFQKGLRAKRPVYEATLRGGRLLRERALLPEDVRLLDQMLGELKERWEAVCSRATERQRKLEEGLLFSGHLLEALQALLDWLCRAEPQLAEEAPVAGDRDLVSALLEQHKVRRLRGVAGFQKELGQRAGGVQALRRSVRELGPRQWLQSQAEELGQRWELVCRLSVSRQARLEAALLQAEEFHRRIRSFLDGLAALEMSVKQAGACAEEAAAVRECQGQLQELRQSLQCQRLELEGIGSLAEQILRACHPDAVIAIRSWVTAAKSRFQEVQSWAQQRDERLQAQAASLAAEQEEVVRLVDWVAAAEESLGLREQEPLPEEAGPLEELGCQHAVFMEELSRKQAEVEKVVQGSKHRPPPAPGGAPSPRRRPSRRRGASRLLPQGAPAVPLGGLEPPSPVLAQLLHRWQQLWLLALDRQCRLRNAQQSLREREDFAHFDFAVWRKRFLQWISQRKSRTLDVFRGMDRDQDGRVTQREFAASVLFSNFPTTALEMSAVASILDTNGDGFIDYYEFVSALHPSRDMLRRTADVDQIQDEVNRQVAQCSCARRFQVEQVSANRYRFGESQQLRMVRILRSTLMVRVGGGWIALDEFLVKNDPCRVRPAEDTLRGPGPPFPQLSGNGQDRAGIPWRGRGRSRGSGWASR
ncbi:hypothetical protein lerEdw1_014456 [Lerista edwardsae]|nr:hypothetical protein lerEdw1_014456 [Lerista edwardsae]